MAAHYLAAVTWEPPEEVEARAARLLPALFLARVDGKSPVEYITAETDKDRVRRVGASAHRLAAQPAGDRQADVGEGHFGMMDTTIAAVRGRRVWDSRGRPTVEVEILLQSGVRGRAIAPPAPQQAQVRRSIGAMAEMPLAASMSPAPSPR